MPISLGRLKAVPYFNGLDDDTINSLAKFVFEKKAERGEIISFEGEPPEALFIVVEGVVKTYKTSTDGKEQIFRIVRPGETFNDAPVLLNETNFISAEAMGPVTLLGIKNADMEKMVAENPVISRNAVRVLAKRVQYLAALVQDFSFLHVTGRVAKMLLDYAEHASSSGPRLTQQEMAAMIGTAREMVGRSLKNLEEEGVIRIEKGRITVTDEKELRRMAGLEA